jgi:osmotically-inducible protein OsmY
MNYESQEYAQDRDLNLKGGPASGNDQHSLDVKIRKEIYKALGDESGIDLHVKNGVVRVTGEVDTSDAMNWVIDTIRSLKSVKDVRNELHSKPFNH